MQQFHPLSARKITVVTSAFIFCCLLSTVRILSDAPSPGPYTDTVRPASDERFAALKAALPPQGIVGYVGDSESPADYYLTQYALAPLIVDHSSSHPLVIGNFSKSPAAGWKGNLQLVKDFGNGVILFANKDAK